MKHKQIGFTLIELMVVVAIIGILAAIAYPSYTEQIRKSKRADAQGALLALGNAMERHFTANGNYLGAATGGADTGAPAAAIYASQVPVEGGTAYYNLTISAATATTYTLQAAAVGSMATDAKCGNLTLTSTGVRGKTGSEALDYCWRK